MKIEYYNFFSSNNKQRKRQSYDAVHYDGLPLTKLAKKKNNLPKRRVDCNCNLIECNEDCDCRDWCLPIPIDKPKCMNGLCVYVRDKNSPCQNGGQITTYFTIGRVMIGCICNDDYLGRFS